MRIILSGSSGFPFGLAEAQKQRMIAKALKHAGNRVWIFNRSGISADKKVRKVNRIGIDTGIPYLFCNKNPYKSGYKIIRYWQKFAGYLYETFFLFRFKPDVVIVSNKSFFYIISYYCLSKIFCFKFFITWVELNSSMKSRKNYLLRINDYLYEHYSFFFMNGIFPISEFLMNKVKARRSHMPMLKIPTLVDMEEFNIRYSGMDGKYFLFCGSAAYYEIIVFIIGSFELVHDQEFELYLIIDGTPKNVSAVINRINLSGKKDLIKIISYVPYQILVEYYINARALLIPLKPDVRDSARFPHKIGEYLASGNPLISTNYGEIRYYFKDKETGLIADRYDISEYAEKMEFIIHNPEESKKIGFNGKELCKRNFDYKDYGNKITEFLLSL